MSEQIFSMTNKTSVIELDGVKHILRVPGLGSDKLINRHEEAEVYSKIKDLHISDEVLYLDPETGIKIAKFILPNAHPCDNTNDEDLKKCMTLLKKLHNAKLEVNHEFNLKDKILFYESLRPESEYSDYEEIKEKVFKLLDCVDRKYAYTLVHIDPNQDNFIIENDEVRLVDWEYAAMQDPLLDIAMFSIYADYKKEQIDHLLEIYLERKPTSQELLLVYVYVAASGLLWSNWCEFKHTCGQEYGGYYEQSQYRFAKEYSEIAMNFNRNAIILAAGRGKRMLKLTEDKPKCLLEVKGEPVIEHTIKMFKKQGINNITIVTGYMADKLEYLKDKYNVDLVYNKDWQTTNSYSSMNCVIDRMAYTIVIDSDIYLYDDFKFVNSDMSGYTGIPHITPVNEWQFDVDGKFDIQNVVFEDNRESGISIIDISYWTSEQSAILKQIFKNNDYNFYKHHFWDEIPCLFNLKDLQLHCFVNYDKTVAEFDTEEELEEIRKHA